MNAEDKRRVIHGEVFFEGCWVPIETKHAAAQQRRKKIEDGYVFYRGEWITIDEKLSRVAPPKPPDEQRTGTVIVNQYDNRTVYNIDNRTVHSHEHRHVHVDGKELEKLSRNRQAGAKPDGISAIRSDREPGKALPDKEKTQSIEDRGKISGLLPSPDETP